MTQAARHQVCFRGGRIWSIDGECIAGLDYLVYMEFTDQRFKEYAHYIKTKLAIG